MSEGIPQDGLTDLKPVSTLPEFAATATQPSSEKLFEERQRVVGEWIDDINKADVALGGSLEPPEIQDSVPADLVERMNPKYVGGWEELVKGRDFVSAGMIVDRPTPLPPLMDVLSGKVTEQHYKNVFFGTLGDGTKVLELVRIVEDYKNRDNGHGGFSISTEIVTDKNKAEVQEVVSDRLNETIAKRKELAEKEQLSSLPKVELPQT